MNIEVCNLILYINLHELIKSRSIKLNLYCLCYVFHYPFMIVNIITKYCYMLKLLHKAFNSIYFNNYLKTRHD